MELVISHLTRMREGAICTAGFDLATGRTVRPVIRHKPLTTELLCRHGGPFDIGRHLDLGPTTPHPEVPHVEDHVFDPARVRELPGPARREFWELLQGHSSPSLADIFGPDFRQFGPDHCGVDLGRGSISLGYFRPPQPPVLRLNDRGRLRVQVTDGTFRADASVTDIRLYQDDHQTPDLPRVEKLNARLQESVAIILAVGLCRPYARDWSQKPISYLQLNNFHLVEYPLWQLH